MGSNATRVGAVTASLVVVAAVSAGCGGSAGQASSKPANGEERTATSAGAPFTRLDPAAFARRMGDKRAVLIDVHVPYEGELPHTDAFVPFDHVVGAPQLPKNKNTEILLYCRTGRMSEIAADALHAAGYSRLAHLEGGMRAWESSGHRLLHDPAHATAGTAGHPM